MSQFWQNLTYAGSKLHCLHKVLAREIRAVISNYGMYGVHMLLSSIHKLVVGVKTHDHLCDILSMCVGESPALLSCAPVPEEDLAL